jgi:hypothetical protein
MSGTTLIQDGSVTTQKVVASSITVDKLATNSVTADKIVANTITGDKIAANAITANLIAAGSISADKLMVGYGPNVLTDPGFQSGSQYWSVGGGFIIDYNGAIPNSNEHTLFIYSTGGGLGQSASVPIPVVAGTTYMASVYACRVGGTGAGNGGLVMVFLNASGAQVGGANVDTPLGTDNTRITGYTRIHSPVVVAPVGAVSVQMFMRHVTTVNDGSNGTWFYRPQIEECLPNQVTPGPWGAAASTIIGPGSVRTGSLSAISANLGAITAGSLNINNKFIVDAAGNTTIQTATSGQRSQIVAGQFLAFDSNNVLRWRAGIW